MGLLDADFAACSRECVDQLAQGAMVTLRRVVTGGINPTTQKRTETNTDLSVKAIRSLSSRDLAGAGRGRGNVVMEEISYQFATVDLTTFVPKEGDRVIDSNGPGGAASIYYVDRVTSEVNGTMTRVGVRSTPVRG